jgi:hypothetical protein
MGIYWRETDVGTAALEPALIAAERAVQSSKARQFSGIEVIEEEAVTRELRSEYQKAKLPGNCHGQAR